MDTRRRPSFNTPAMRERPACVAIIATLLGCAGSNTMPSLNHATPPNAEFLEQYAATYRFRLGRPTSIRLTPNGDAVLFLRSGPRNFSSSLYTYDPATKTESLLLTADKLLAGSAESLTDEEKARRERMRVTLSGITAYTMSRDGRRLLVPLSGRVFCYDRTDGTTKDLGIDGAFDAQLDPAGARVAFVKDQDLYVHDLGSGNTTRLTDRGGNDALSHGIAEFVAQEEMNRYHGYWFSADGTRIAFQRTDETKVETLYVMDPANPAKAPQPFRYPRAGTTNADVRLGITATGGGDTTWVQWDRARYPYLLTVRWSAGAPLTLVVQDRNQTEVVVLAVDEATGTTKTLLTDSDAAWVNVHQEAPHWLSDGSAFLWVSERNGYPQLELRGRDGSLVRAVTPLDIGFRDLVQVSADDRTAIFRASADPTQIHLYRVALSADATAPEKLSTEVGEHHGVFATTSAASVRVLDPMDGAPTWRVTNDAGADAGSLASVAERPKFDTAFELTTVEVEGRTHHASITRPQSFDPAARYPVVVHVYGGPWHQMVAAVESRFVFDQWLADHGFIVVSIDGRGTPGRGRDWERAIKNDLIAIPLADQTAALLKVLAKYEEMDADRVGIYGWSFGGYFSAMAVMQRPDVFRVGVAGAPVADWRDYDTHYTERYMALPADNAAGYDAASVLTHAAKLSRPLMIIHGTSDDNVYFTHAIRMSDALFRAGKDFDFLPLAGLTHMVPDPVVSTRLNTKIADYFVRHLAR